MACCVLLNMIIVPVQPLSASGHVLVCDFFTAAVQSFQSLVIFFIMKHTQREALLSAINRLTSHITSSPDDNDNNDDVSESMFDMECQHMGTHVAGYPTLPQSVEMELNASASEAQQSGNRSSPVFGRRSIHDVSGNRSSPVFGRRSIHDVKPTAGLQALHEYDECGQEDEPEDPLQSSSDQIEEIVVPVGFNSPVIKYVNHVHTIMLFSFAIYCSCGQFLSPILAFLLLLAPMFYISGSGLPGWSQTKSREP